MLYDPRWEQKTDRELFGISLRAMIAWLETKPADEEYDYIDAPRCAIAQYLQAQGRSEDDSVVDFWPTPEPSQKDYWLFDIACTVPWTFGAALERARKYCR
jgi:hypothetical protein